MSNLRVSGFRYSMVWTTFMTFRRVYIQKKNCQRRLMNLYSASRALGSMMQRDLVGVLGASSCPAQIAFVKAVQAMHSDAFEAKLFCLVWAAMSCQLLFNELPLDGSIYYTLEYGQSSETDDKFVHQICTLHHGSIKLIVSNLDNY